MIRFVWHNIPLNELNMYFPQIQFVTLEPGYAEKHLNAPTKTLA